MISEDDSSTILAGFVASYAPCLVAQWLSSAKVVGAAFLLDMGLSLAMLRLLFFCEAASGSDCFFEPAVYFDLTDFVWDAATEGSFGVSTFF
jgi:hypothetical protein